MENLIKLNIDINVNRVEDKQILPNLNEKQINKIIFPNHIIYASNLFSEQLADKVNELNLNIDNIGIYSRNDRAGLNILINTINL